MPAVPKPGEMSNGYRFLGGEPSAATSWEPLHGDDFLKSLPQQHAPLVPLIKKYAEGDMPVPTAAAMRNPQVMQLLEMAAQYDPSFNAADYPSRASTRKDFTSGAAAKNITSFNTVLQHLGKMSEDAAALHNHSFTPLNTVGNAIEPLFGDARVNNFNTDKNAVVSELVRAFRGSGGSAQDIEDWAKTFDPNGSPEQLSGAIKRGVELLNGRIEALGDQYNRGMKRSRDPVELLSPGAREVFKRLQGDPLASQHVDSPSAGAAKGPPAGVDSKIWGHMTPQEKALWP